MISAELSSARLPTVSAIIVRRAFRSSALARIALSNLLCIAFGANPVQFADLVQAGYLPPRRSPRCKREYEKVADAFQKEISLHIDHEMAKKVLNSNWLPGPPVLRRVPQK
jgi:hypothetical protein